MILQGRFQDMKKIIALPIIWAFVFLSFAQANPTDLPFYNGSMNQLQEQARQSRVPYVVYFYVLECEPCRKMQKETFNHDPLIKYVEQHYMAYRVDGLDFLSGIDIAKQYGVRSYPTTIIFGPDGDVRKRMEGYISGTEMTKSLMSSVRSGDRNNFNKIASSNSFGNTSTNTSARNMPPAGANPTYNTSTNTNSSLPSWASSTGNKTTLYADPLTESGTGRGQSNNAASTNTGTDKRDFVSEYLNYRANQVTGDDNGYSKTNTYNNTQSAYNNTANYTGNSNPGYVNPYAPQQPVSTNNTNTAAGTTRSQNDPGSFLDPVNQASANQGGLPDYVWNGDQWVSRGSLPADAQLYLGADGQWHVAQADGSNMRTRGVDAAAPGSEVPVETIHVVPGFGSVSPKLLKSETYGLLVGEYDAITAAKEGLTQFKGANPGIPVWVYAERKGTSTVYKLAMGAYSTPDAATTDAMARGAQWEEIRVVQLNE